MNSTTFQHKYNVGDTVYHIKYNGVSEAKIISIDFCTKGEIYYYFGHDFSLAENLFSNREDAEKEFRRLEILNLKSILENKKKGFDILKASIENTEKKIKELES